MVTVISMVSMAYTYLLFIQYIVFYFIKSDGKGAYCLLSCQGHSPWEVDYNHSSLIHDTQIFQEWLYAYQHNPWRCKTYGIETWSADRGIATSIIRSVATMERALENAKIYRPTLPYFWASNSKDCTFNTTYFDCYFKEFSSCGLKLTQTQGFYSEPMDRDDRNTTLGRMLQSSALDICILAKTLKKSMAWVAGQYLTYVLRLKPSMKMAIHSRIKGIYDDIDQSKQSVISVQYRSGKPDMGRTVLSLDSYMEMVKQKAVDLASEGRPVAFVYLASQNNEKVFQSPEYMLSKYGGNYTYKFLKTLPKSLSINSANEIETELDLHPDVPREPYMIEFLSDLQLLVRADVFIGSVSTIHILVMLLRYARRPNRNKKYTCLMSADKDILCEDDSRKYQYYNQYGFWTTMQPGTGETSKGGFEGGTPF